MSARRAPRPRPDARAATGPVRSCVVCRTRRAQDELVRLVVAEGRVVTDANRRLEGRGAYACPGCLAEATGPRAPALRRALRAPDVTVEPLDAPEPSAPPKGA